MRSHVAGKLLAVALAAVLLLGFPLPLRAEKGDVTFTGTIIAGQPGTYNQAGVSYGSPCQHTDGPGVDGVWFSIPPGLDGRPATLVYSSAAPADVDAYFYTRACQFIADYDLAQEFDEPESGTVPLHARYVVVSAGYGANITFELRVRASGGERFGKSAPLYRKSVVETARVPMRDGETLFVEIKRPVVPKGVRVPVILTMSPYNGSRSPFPPEVDGGLTASSSLAEFYVPRGYARAIADVRGTRESSGCWDYGGLKERRDGYDLVEWLGTRSWSNGKVGMIGVSYEGLTGNAAAVERPPHLATIVPMEGIDRWYDYAYMNGVRWGENDEGGLDTPAYFDFGPDTHVPPVDARSPRWTDVVADRYRPCERMEHTERGYDLQPDYDAFWRARDYRALGHRVTIPALVVHGLDDWNVKPTAGTKWFERLAGPKRLLLGQWGHCCEFTTASGKWMNLLWRWFDHWLLGLDTGVMDEPAVDVQDTTGAWHRQESWPAPGSVNRVSWLRSDGRLVSRPAGRGSSPFVDDPSVTEERMMEEGADPARVRFLGQPMPKRTRISGEPRLSLSLSSDKTSTHIAALLADLAPDGSWTVITRGFMNPRYRRGLAVGEDLVPDKKYKVDFALQPVEHVIEKGHRIGLVISSSNAAWVLPDLQLATNRVFFGPKTGSKLTLPVAVVKP